MRRLLPIAILVSSALLASGCATTRAARERKHRSDVQQVLDQALFLLGDERIRVDNTPYRSDCSGFVTAVYDTVSVILARPGVGGSSGTEIIYRTMKAEGDVVSGKRAKPGDLVFFHNTWDSNGNGLRDDRFSHIGIVESVRADGTIGFVHYASGRVKRDVMNLEHRSEARAPDGTPWNSYMRRGGGKVLTGQLFFRFARPLEP